jgi:hypothetical protein
MRAFHKPCAGFDGQFVEGTSSTRRGPNGSEKDDRPRAVAAAAMASRHRSASRHTGHQLDAARIM